MKKLGLTGVLVMLVACYPGDVSSISELDVVMTRYASDFSFGQVARFTMPDTIIHLNTDDPNAIDIPRDNDDDTLDKVRTNLLALGWEEVDWDDAEAGAAVDVAVLNLASATENTQWWASYPPGGCWWYPCWGWGWYWPPTIGVTSYDAGTYFMVMADVDGVAESDTTAAVWGGAVNGVLSSSGASNFQRLLNGIDQAFTQSPYLRGSTGN
ncbi:MAG: DUF4136 domain-containing protein [Gemmatimonadales bacterium]|jgi:hypothetical protein